MENDQENGLNVAQAFEQVLKTLTYRERELIKLRYGLGDGYSYSLAEVSRIFRVTRERARQIEAKAVLKLQHPVRRRYLEKVFKRAEEERPHIQTVETIAQVTQLTPYLITHLKTHHDDLTKVPWKVFEQLIAEFFASWGFTHVRLVGHNPYTAADIFAVQKNDATDVRIRFFVEIKRTRKRVGIEVIDRVYGALCAERAKWGWHLAMIVSAVGFSETQKYTVTDLRLMGIELRDKKQILKWLDDYRPNDKGLWLPSPAPYLDPHPPDQATAKTNHGNKT